MRLHKFQLTFHLIRSDAQTKVVIKTIINILGFTLKLEITEQQS